MVKLTGPKLTGENIEATKSAHAALALIHVSTVQEAEKLDEAFHAVEILAEELGHSTGLSRPAAAAVVAVDPAHIVNAGKRSKFERRDVGWRPPQEPRRVEEPIALPAAPSADSPDPKALWKVPDFGVEKEGS